MSPMVRIRPSGPMNAIDSGTYVFFIQNASRCGSLNTNSMPWSGCRLNRFMSPVLRVSPVAAISATSRWPLMASSMVGSGAAWASVAMKVKANSASLRGELIRLDPGINPHLQLILLAVATERRFDRRTVELRGEHGDELVHEAAGVHASAQSEPRGARRE